MLQHIARTQGAPAMHVYAACPLRSRPSDDFRVITGLPTIENEERAWSLAWVSRAFAGPMQEASTMHLMTAKLQKDFLRAQHVLSQPDRAVTVEGYLQDGKTLVTYQRDLNALIQSVPQAAMDDRGRLLADSYLRARSLRTHCREAGDHELSDESNRLMQRISSYVHRRTESTWKLVELTAEKVKHFHAEIREAFEHEVAKVMDEEYVTFQAYHSQEKTISEYLALIYSHLVAAERAQEPTDVLHELALALMQFDSLRHYAKRQHYDKLKTRLENLESSILEFVDTESQTVWTHVISATQSLRDVLAREEENAPQV